ncbi:MAG: ATP synthase F0 subunit B [Planctomycetota bacterium]|nr:MAG: ATP synthase F0 subunit B [Planctomycetota bacterium]
MHLPILLVLASEEGGGGLNAIFSAEYSFWWTLLIFLVSLPLMWKVVFGPIADALDRREQASREARLAAEAAREEAQRIQEAMKKDLEAARQEANQQVADARARAETREKEILAAAQEQAEADRRRAQEEIERALQSARQTLRAEAVALGVEIAEQVMERKFSAEDHQRLVSSFQEEMRS